MENTAPNTNNFLNWVEIKNFKSIKDLRLDCKRVNVFIGKPNVGKSNILEGLGLLGADYNGISFLRGMVRYEDLKQLFYDNSTLYPVQINTANTSAFLSRTTAYFKNGEQNYEFYLGPSTNTKLLVNGNLTKDQIENAMIESPHTYVIDEQGVFAEGSRDKSILRQIPLSDVKKYDYHDVVNFEIDYPKYLLPSGLNLYSVIRRRKELWAEFAKLFIEQQLELVLYDEKQEFILQKKDGPFVTQYPFFSIADTFRRFMFYITAIESNKNSIIVFEEPEVHSFPPYVKTLAHRIVSSDTNQFFVSTHSPYLLQTLIRELDPAELSVFITYYKDYQTCVRALTPDELQEAEDLSIDLFYNLNRYEPNA